MGIYLDRLAETDRAALAGAWEACVASMRKLDEAALAEAAANPIAALALADGDGYVDVFETAMSVRAANGDDEGACERVASALVEQLEATSAFVDDVAVKTAGRTCAAEARPSR